MRKLGIYFFVVISLVFLTRCSLILGIHKVKHKTDEQIFKAARKLGISQANLFVLDNSYAKYIFGLDQAVFKTQTKNHYQPLQALYFKENGELTKFYINCYAGGFTSLDWNRDGKLNVFPPNDQAPIDTVLNFRKQVSYVKSIGSSSIDTLKGFNSDYKVFVYWNIYMYRHSKKLVNEIKKNCSLSKDGKTVKIIYVNNDNWFAELDKK